MTNPDPTKIYLSPVEKDNIKQNSATRQLIEAASATANTVAGLRTRLTADTTFYVSTSGNDSTGDGSVGNPWLTGQNAGVQITNNYDGGGNNVTLQLVGSPFNVPAGESFVYLGAPLVGIQKLIVRGDPSSPSSFVIDGTLSGGGGDGINFAPTGAGSYLDLDGFTLQNWGHAAVNNQADGSFIDIGAVNFAGGNSTCLQCESGGTISGRGGTITFSGTNGQLLFCGASSIIDTNNSPIVFSAATFSFVGLNVTEGGFVHWYNSITGNFTGQSFFINNGGIIEGVDGGGSPIDWFDMPGSVLGINFGGYFNNSNTPIMNFGDLPTTPNNGYRAEIVDGLAGNCADGTCTTFGTHVTGGGGALNLLIWWNGSNWTLIGK